MTILMNIVDNSDAMSRTAFISLTRTYCYLANCQVILVVVRRLTDVGVRELRYVIDTECLEVISNCSQMRDLAIAYPGPIIRFPKYFKLCIGTRAAMRQDAPDSPLATCTAEFWDLFV